MDVMNTDYIRKIMDSQDAFNKAFTEVIKLIPEDSSTTLGFILSRQQQINTELENLTQKALMGKLPKGWKVETH
jgi:hypothetical protein